LLEAVGRGEFFLNGFRNRNLQGLFFSQAADSVQEKRCRSAWVSRQIRLLRAHGLVRKVAHENRYQVTAFGRRVISAVLAARKATVSQLSKAA
jgi:DNA-binding HxlR family transcriptional regulator